MTGIDPAKYPKELLEKAYVRVLLDDDTFTTPFAKVVKQKKGDSEQSDGAGEDNGPHVV